MDTLLRAGLVLALLAPVGLTVPPAFTIERIATVPAARELAAAPNGDLFLADSSAGEIKVLRGVGPDGKAKTVETYATGLDHPFGIA